MNQGLIKAMETVIPNVEHRFCVMHMYKNFWKHYKGSGLKHLLWNCARASNSFMFKRSMKNLLEANKGAHDWVAERPPEHWSRAFFRTTPLCDMFLNNHCEVFNSKIKKARDKPIITCLENIRRYCMIRIQKRYTKQLNRTTAICPRPLKALNIAVEKSAGCIPEWSGNKYGVTTTVGGHVLVVDLKNRTCECRKWDLTGIPCFHAVAYIFNQQENLLNYVHKCYSREMYLKLYEHFIEPIGEDWPETSLEPLMPPIIQTPSGRPKKVRRKINDVPSISTTQGGKTKIKRSGTSVRCGFCKDWGHNTRTCHKVYEIYC